jgi:hypothetical protein
MYASSTARGELKWHPPLHPQPRTQREPIRINLPDCFRAIYLLEPLGPPYFLPLDLLGFSFPLILSRPDSLD